ncbi:MAG: amidohydrolase family protein [Clostridiales bacterium]|nr:amidohydrolase family protein [Eubacteriales bacterium]MDH7567500.1 amidohydrolase family protein [Clostridiales bacterium]
MKEHKIIDIHTHIFPEKIAEKAVESIGKYYNIPMYGAGTAADLLQSGKKIHVSKYVIHSTATKVEQVRSINDFIAGVAAGYSSIVGFGTLHPGLENVGLEVDRIISLGLKGIKLHPEFQEFNIDDEDMLPVYKAAEGKLPILMHMGDEVKTSSSPERLVKILGMFPDLTVIAAHFGGYQMWDQSMEHLVGKNVYFDTSSTLFRLDRRKAVEIIRKHGVNKILFGTDYPMWDHAGELERFNRLELTEEERELILWKNADRLLNIGL